MDGLSRQQENILLHLLRRTWERLQFDMRNYKWVPCYWAPGGEYGAQSRGDLSRSESASISRALRRLEARGLVRRFNMSSGSTKRAQHVNLTLTGTRCAALLACVKWGADWWERHCERLTV